jgi:pyruvate/2-oxoglutarate dehydrogenase complex dihydrolipoamide dehydrogenase (E3) component
MAKAYDVAIIGADTAGLTARAEVSKRTENYVALDGGILGTTCARVGCMPSKSLIQVANAFHEQLLLKKFEILDNEISPLDLQKVMMHVRRLRDRFVGGVEKGMESWKQHPIRKNARFVVGESNYKRQGRALMMGRNEGKVRLYAGKKDGVILGAELLAPDGEHLAHLIA